MEHQQNQPKSLEQLDVTKYSERTQGMMKRLKEQAESKMDTKPLSEE